MNPIKAHLLNALRPEKTMTTISDEEAFALGVRAVGAGMQPGFGVAMLTRGGRHGAASFWFHGVVTDIGQGSVRVAIGDDFELNIWSQDVAGKMIAVPDLRDPGTKGHAVAQLRERTGDPYLTVHCRLVPWNGAECPEWSFPSIDVGPCFTEEEAIVSTFEHSKETP